MKTPKIQGWDRRGTLFLPAEEGPPCIDARLSVTASRLEGGGSSCVRSRKFWLFQEDRPEEALRAARGEHSLWSHIGKEIGQVVRDG
jgi:hypothetical protein